jgi:hypothetical protein
LGAQYAKQIRFWVKKMFKLQAMEAGTPEVSSVISETWLFDANDGVVV